MNFSDADLQRIQLQLEGFIHTPDLLIDQKLLPYPNLKVNAIEEEDSSMADEYIQELNQHLFLGKRIEIFFKYWLSKQKSTKLLAFSQQVIQEKITLGEFDFLWKTAEKFHHTEVVYKQYIYIKNLGKNELHSWVGPNKRDFLHLKLTKLREQQFPLLFHPLSQKILKEKFHLEADDFQQSLCFKAQLYLHFKERKKTFEGINSKAIVGKWYYFKEFKHQRYDDYQFALIHKQDWPIIPQNASDIIWRNFDEVGNQVALYIQRKRSVKLWMKTPTQINQLFVIWEDTDLT